MTRVARGSETPCRSQQCRERRPAGRAAQVRVHPRHVRFTPESGHSSGQSWRPLCAKSIHSKASVLRKNMWRRMMMRYAPFISPLGDKHGEARWARNRFAIDHPSESVKASDHDGVIVDYDCAPFINRILVTGSFGGREISYDRLGPLGNNRADSSEKNCIRPIVLGDDFWIVGAISSRPPINCRIRIFCWARRSYGGQP